MHETFLFQEIDILQRCNLDPLYEKFLWNISFITRSDSIFVLDSKKCSILKSVNKQLLFKINIVQKKLIGKEEVF